MLALQTYASKHTVDTLCKIAPITYELRIPEIFFSTSHQYW